MDEYLTPKGQWRGHYERLRYEAKHFAAMAKAQRAAARDCRARRDWLGELKASSSARDLQRDSAARAADARTLKTQWGF